MSDRVRVILLSPLILVAWLIWPFVTIYLAITWDGR